MTMMAPIQTIGVTTPDLPTAYGYHDPMLFIYPPSGSSSKIVAIRVIDEESGNNEPDRGIRVYSGPGVKYSVLGWTGKDQIFVADATSISTIVGDDVNREWYRIYLPNRLGQILGWLASKKADGTPLVQEETTATIDEIINDEGIGWRLRLDPGVESFVRVWDNVYLPNQGRYDTVRVWNGQKFVMFSLQTVGAQFGVGFIFLSFISLIQKPPIRVRLPETMLLAK